MRTLEQLLLDLEYCHEKNRGIDEDIKYLTERGELRRLFGLPDVFFAIYANQRRIRRIQAELRVLVLKNDLQA